MFKAGLHRFEDYKASLELEAEVCIIGGGAGGCAAAAALADAGIQTVLLEEGRAWKPRDFKASAAWAFQHLYSGRGTRATKGNCIIPLPGGRGLGGSTLINSAICFKTPPAVLAQWRNEGCSLLTDTHMKGCFERIWRTLGVRKNPEEVQRNNNLIFKKGVEALGWSGGDFLDRSAPACTGCARCQQGCPSGGKFTADRTFLAEALLTGTLGVYPDCKITGVETEGGRVIAVTGRLIHPEGYTEAGFVRVHAKRFLLAGGSIGSPRFLLQNGLSSGPVGQHLKIHPTLGMFARFPTPIRAWSGATQGYYVDRWQEGFLLQTAAMPPDQQYLSLLLPPEASLSFLQYLPYLASAGVVVHDEDSSGSVTEGSLNYQLGEGDKKRLLKGLRACAEVFFAAGALEVAPGAHRLGLLQPGVDLFKTIPDTIPPYELGLYAAHPMGTCRMGGSPGSSVVNPEGKVWEWENLYIADASVFPSSLGVNPQVTVMALGLTIGAVVAKG